MKILFHLFFLILIFLINTSACSTSPADLQIQGDQKTEKSVYLVGHGWHAGIILKQADVPEKLWPEINDFPEAEFLEVGWGDMDYYQMQDPHIGIILKAALLPSSSVLHIVGFKGPITDYFPHSEIIELRLTQTGFEKMVKKISGSYLRDEKGQSIFLGPGLYGNSRFYQSKETYHLFKTCNVWTSKILQMGGVPVRSAIRLENLMSQARKLGTVVSVNMKTR